MNWMKRMASLLLAVLLVASMAPAGLAEEGDAAVLRIALEQDIETIDPQQNTAAFTCAVTEGISEPLLRSHEGEILPGLAESYSTEDYQTWTFNIREDACWSDGTPITAEDIAWSYSEIFLRPECAKVYILFNSVKGYAEISEAMKADATEEELRQVIADNFGVTALDEHTLQVVLESPRPYNVDTFCSTAWAPIKRDLYEQYGNAYGSAADKIGMNGPFVVSEWRYNEQVTLEKNPNYWNSDAIQLDRVEIVIVKDVEPRVNLFKEGKLDSAKVSSDYLLMMPDDTFVLEGTSWNYMLVNSYRRDADGNLVNESLSKLLANRNFVNAMNNAINRTTLFSQVIVDPSYLPTNYIIPASINSNNLNRDTIGDLRGDRYGDIAPLTKNEEKAKEYLAAALEETGFASADEVPTLKIVCTSSSDPETIAEYLVNALSQTLGIKFEVEPVEFNVRDSRIISGDYDLLYMGWGVSNNDALGYLDVWADDLFCTGWPQSDPETYEAFCALISEISTSSDMDARAEKILEAEELLLNYGPFVTLSSYGTALLMSDRFEDFTVSNTNSLYDYVFAHLK